MYVQHKNGNLRMVWYSELIVDVWSGEKHSISAVIRKLYLGQNVKYIRQSSMTIIITKQTREWLFQRWNFVGELSDERKWYIK